MIYMPNIKSVAANKGNNFLVFSLILAANIVIGSVLEELSTNQHPPYLTGAGTNRIYFFIT